MEIQKAKKIADQIAIFRDCLATATDADLAAACALLGYIPPWPGLTAEYVSHHLNDESMEMVQRVRLAGYQPPVHMWD